MSTTNKFILWSVLVAVTSFWMWASVQVWLSGPLFEVENVPNLVILSALFIVLLSLLSVGLVIFRKHLWSVYLGLIVGIIYSLLFKVSNLNLVGIFILVMLFYHAHDLVSGEIKSRIKMNSNVLIRKGLSNFIVAFFVLASFAAYQSPAIESFKNTDKLPSSSEVFIKSVIAKTFGDQIETNEPGQREAVLNQVSNETIHELNTFLGPYFQYMPPVLAFGLFLLLWGVGWIFIWLSVFLGMLILFILRKINFYKLEEYDVKAQRIVI